MARPTKLTPELQTKLCALLEAEWYMVHACAEVGIHPDTVYGWLREATKEDASADIIEFSVACARARAKGERSILERMELFAQEKKEKDWKVLSWKLERLRQDVFHLTTKTELSGPGGKPIQIATGKDITAMTTEEVRALARGESRPSAGASST